MIMKDTRLLVVGLLAAVLLVAVLLKSAINKPVPAFRSEVQGVPSASLSKTDASGAAWTLEQSGGALVSTEPNGPKAGAPILVKTDVQKVGEREMSIGLLLEGQGGEQYRPVVKKNGASLPEPGVRIVNEAGQVVAQGRFQYYG
jgi:hypothetical protein